MALTVIKRDVYDPAMPDNQYLLAAIRAVEPPTQARLAELCHVVPMAVSHWMRRGVPARRCAAIEKATGGAVTRRQLRPDLFGADGGRIDPNQENEA
jgi:hypothetical protein